MIRLGANTAVWAFDAEWVPDVGLGRRLYGLPATLSDLEVMEHMWQQAGADEDNPRPFLKTVLCRIVSVAAVTRSVEGDGEVRVSLFSLPRLGEARPISERDIIERFLTGVGEKKPQLVGYNSKRADLRIFIQRGIGLGVAAPGFCAKPYNRWEGPDYLQRWDNDFNVDLFDAISGPQSRGPALREMAAICGIPGKIVVPGSAVGDGNDVAEAWLDGRLEEIVQYNELDAITTYLLWLRVAHFGGVFSWLQYHEECRRLEALLESLCERSHISAYLGEWLKLRDAMEHDKVESGAL